MNQWFNDVTPGDVCTPYRVDRQVEKGFVSEYLTDNVASIRQYAREPQSNLGIGTNSISTNSGVDILRILCGAPISTPNQILLSSTYAKNHPDRVNWVYLLNPLDVPSIKSVIYTIPAETHALFVLPFARDCVNRSFEIQIQTFWQSTFTIYTGVDTSVVYAETPLKRSLSVNVICSQIDINASGIYIPSKNVMTCNDYIGFGPFTTQPSDETLSNYSDVSTQNRIYPRGTLKIASDGHRWIVSGCTQMLCTQIGSNESDNSGGSGGGGGGGGGNTNNTSLYTQILTTPERLAMIYPTPGLAVYDSTMNSMFISINGIWSQVLDVPSSTSTLTLPGGLVVPSSSSQVSIGTTTPFACSALQVNSTSQGFLPPVMTATQRVNISSPANGLMVYDSTLNALLVYSNGVWTQVVEMPATSDNLVLPGELLVPNGQVLIGNGTPSDPTSVLQVASTSKGFLPPVMSTTQRDSIVNPADGLQVYDSSVHANYVFTYNNGWVQTLGAPDSTSTLTLPGSLSVPNGKGAIGISTPDSSSIFQLASTLKGFLPPVMSSTQRLAITSPANGLYVHDSSFNAPFTYGNSTWSQVVSIPSTTGVLTVPGELYVPSGQVVIGTTTTPDPSSVLQINTTTQGFLPPVLTSSQRTGILNPANGLQVFDSTTNTPYVYASGAWNKINLFKLPTTTTLTGVIVGDQTSTYYPPTGAVYLYVEVFGCGGSGGAYTYSVNGLSAGGGGGGGAYASFYMLAQSFSVKFSANDGTATTHTTGVSDSGGNLFLSVSNGANGQTGGTWAAGASGLNVVYGGSGGIVSAYNNFKPTIAADGSPGSAGMVLSFGLPSILANGGTGGSSGPYGSYANSINATTGPVIIASLATSVLNAQLTTLSFGAGGTGGSFFYNNGKSATNPSPGGVIVHEYYC